MSNAVVHFEIIGKNGEQTMAFYSTVFGWQINAENPMNYGLVEPVNGKGIGGGVAEAQDGKPYATFYVEVDDLEKTLKKVEQSGGKTVVPVTEIPGMVTFAMFADPDGNILGLVKSEKR